MGEEEKVQDDQLPVPCEGNQVMVKNEVKYMTAVQVAKPRDLGRCLRNIEVVIKRNPFSMFYSWDIQTKTGSKTVQGATIGAANIIASMLGNNVVEADVVAEDEDHWLLKAYYIDLETGHTNTRLFRQRKSQVEGKYDEERKLDIAFQIGQSKAKRNIILESNKWLADYLLDMAKKAGREQIDGDPKASRDAALQFFKDRGVTRLQIEEKIGKKIEDFDGGDVTILRGYAQALQDGEARVEDIFGGKKEIVVDVTDMFEGASAKKE